MESLMVNGMEMLMERHMVERRVAKMDFEKVPG
jgi:hypothetical protein